MLLQRIAVGGMAELFLAREESSHRRVVIKRILPYLSDEEEFVQMFLDEARIASQLHHKNIIQVYELGKLDGQIFIAMEYVEGVDLRRILQEELKVARVVPYRFAAFITAKVCGGLYYAHNALGRDGKPMTIVHRDVSPQNVMVGQNGEVKLVDFGIAKAGALVERSKPGVIKGKFLYLAPEQLAQEKVDHRADLFAVGTMMYEVTTGKSPFYKPTTEAVIYAVRTEDPPPPHIGRPQYPLALSRIVMKCLSKDRTRRYQTADEIKNDLEVYLRSEERTDDAAVREYIARLLGIEDESTVLVDPSQVTGARPAPSVGRRITPSELELRARVNEPEPRTQAEGPLAKALDRNAAPKPGVRATGIHPPKGPLDEGDTQASGPQEVSAHSLPDSLPRVSRNLAADLPRTGELGFEPPSEPDDTHPTLARWGTLLAQNPLALGGLALVGVVLAGVLLYSLFSPSDRKDPSDPQPLAEKRSAVSPLAGLIDAGAPDAGPVLAETPPPPLPKDSPVTPRVMVQFKAPVGTLISGRNQNFAVGKRYFLPPGRMTVLCQCPAKKGKKRVQANLSVVVAPQPSGIQTVRLCNAK